MTAWDIFKTILNGWGEPLWPDAKPLPDHVKNLKFNAKLILMHMQEAEKPRIRNGFTDES